MHYTCIKYVFHKIYDKNNILSKNAFMSTKNIQKHGNTNFVTQETLRDLAITPPILDICRKRTSSTFF